MEGAHVLKSIELLTLRRNRMSKNSSGIVERNQSLVSYNNLFFICININNTKIDNRDAEHA